MEQLTDADRAADKVVALAKALVLADNHFLSAAVGRLRVVHGVFAYPLATNGRELGIDSAKVCRGFKAAKAAPKHDLLHTVLHCVFLHPYVDPSINERLWSLACDIAVERNVALVCGRRDGSRGSSIERALDKVATEVGDNVTAEKIYKALCAGKWANEIEEWETLFASDDHAPWYAWQQPQDTVENGNGGSSDKPNQQNQEAGGSDKGEDDSRETGSDQRAEDDSNPDGQQGQGNDVDSSDADGVDPAGQQGEFDNPDRSQGEGAGSSASVGRSLRGGAHLRTVELADRSAERDGWRRVAKALAVNLQTYSKGRGQALGGMVDEIEETLHDRVDYGDFLRQFAIPGEVLKVSEDEFDYIFYTYGLTLYGNLPLIEPLEYREEKRVREFVIVIDTSGSVQGEIVRRFIDTTFDILKSTEAFFERVHIRIIQCDAQVQSDDVVKSLDELREWGRAMRVMGCGGTDFRPAFAYVDRLVEDGEFENLGGLVYFTDGWGVYPEWMPDYKVAFAFYDDNYRPEVVPTWAAQIVLDEQAIGTGNW